MLSTQSKVLLISGLIFSCLAINRTYVFAKNKETQLTSKNHKNKTYLTKYLNKLQKVKIIADEYLSPDIFKDLIIYSYKNGKINIEIQESKLENVIKPFIREHLQKIFLKRGWNFAELGGKIYYEINKNNLELYVLWRNNMYSTNYTYYDRMSIAFR